MECEVVVADLYSANGKLQSAEYIWCKKGKELILSAFIYMNNTNPTRRIYISALADTARCVPTGFVILNAVKNLLRFLGFPSE